MVRIAFTVDCLIECECCQKRGNFPLAVAPQTLHDLSGRTMAQTLIEQMPEDWHYNIDRGTLCNICWNNK